MEEELRAVLLADSAVSSRAGDRVNWGEHPQGEQYPAVVLHGISDVPTRDLDGSNGLSKSRVQADCYAASYGEAKQLSRAVRDALDGYSGGVLQGVFYANARDGREGGSNEVERFFRTSIDFMISYNS